MKKKKDIEMVKKVMEQAIKKSYTPGLWSRFKDFIGVFVTALFILICIIGIFVLGITLLENPISLAILCGTVLLIFIWSKR